MDKRKTRTDWPLPLLGQSSSHSFPWFESFFSNSMTSFSRVFLSFWMTGYTVYKLRGNVWESTMSGQVTLYIYDYMTTCQIISNVRICNTGFSTSMTTWLCHVISNVSICNSGFGTFMTVWLCLVIIICLDEQQWV